MHADAINIFNVVGLNAVVAGIIALITGLATVKVAVTTFVILLALAFALLVSGEGDVREATVILPFLLGVEAIGFAGAIPGAALGGYVRRRVWR